MQSTQSDRMDHKEQYRRKLPHIQPKDAMFFITMRLKGTLPKAIIQHLTETKEQVQSSCKRGSKPWKEANEDYNTKIEHLLDSAAYGPVWLNNEDVAKVVGDSLHYHDGLSFKLVCYCIMSNHVHFIAYKFQKPVFRVINILKTFTAKQSNKLLGTMGRFWQREYYDRIIRDRNDLSHKIKYVLNNPVNANLVDDWRNWKWNYCRSEFIEM